MSTVTHEHHRLLIVRQSPRVLIHKTIGKTKKLARESCLFFALLVVSCFASCRLHMDLHMDYSLRFNVSFGLVVRRVDCHA